MRTLICPTILLLSVVPAGCGIDVEVVDSTIEKQITWRQEPGEIQDCHVFKLNNARAIEIERLQVKFRSGSHHVHLYRSHEAAPDDVYDCFNGIDWQKWSLILGAQTQSMDWQLPQGVTLPLEPHQQLLVQVHWLNTTGAAVDEKIDIAFHTTEESEEHLGVLFGVNKRIALAPNEKMRTEHFCPVPEGAKLHAVMGHFHAHGEDYKMIERMPDQSDGKLLYEAPNEPAFEFKLFSPAHEVAKGAGFQYECGFFNYDSWSLSWGSDTKTQEHCNMTAYYSPATDTRSLCLLESSKLSKLTPVKDNVRAGEDMTFEIELGEAEGQDVDIQLASADPTVLEVPSYVTMPKGQTKIAFTARTHRPSPVEVVATLNGAKVTMPVTVTGLAISEVFYATATGANNNKQWVEIVNTSNVAIDLSKYSVGAGSSDFMRTRINLPTMIPARGCIVVGGVDSDPSNHYPHLDLRQNFSPSIGSGGLQAEGVALFASGAQGIAPTSLPIDVVVYAGQNSTLKGPNGQIAPVWPGAAPGGSLKRITENVWTKSSPTNGPTPNYCEILDAH